MPEGGEGRQGGPTTGRPKSRGKRQGSENGPVAAARSRRTVCVVPSTKDVQAGAVIARARSGTRGKKISNRVEGSRTGKQTTARDEGEDRQCDPAGTAAEVSQSDDETGTQNVSREDPVKNFSWHLAGVPQLGSIVETKWLTTFRKEAPSSPHGTSESENSDSGNDGNFTPHAKKFRARKRPSKRAKKTRRHEEERWWPGIVTKLQIESDLSVSGVIKYTFQEDDHGILPGAGPSQFTGRTCRVMFEARTPGEPAMREVHHCVDGKDGGTAMTPWRYFAARADGGGPSTSLGLPGLHGFGLHESAAPAVVTLAPTRALPHSISAAAGVCPPSALRALQTYGMQKLVCSLQAMAQPPPHIKSVCTADLDVDADTEAARGRVLVIGAAFQATQSEFAELASWLCRERPGGRRARVSVRPREGSFRHPAPQDTSFRVMFHDYGDFCEAVHVPFRLRSVFLYDHFLARQGSPALCVVGSVQTWESAESQNHAFVGPLKEGIVRMGAANRHRVVLLGHSWKQLVSYKPVDGSDDVSIPLLRQRDITYDMEGHDSQHPFKAEIGASAARIVEEASGKLRSEDAGEEGSFDIEWSRIPPQHGIPWTTEDQLGTVSFRIALVCIRSASLVTSARMLLDNFHDGLGDEESESEAEARLQRAQDLRYAVTSPLEALREHTQQ